MIDAPNPLKLFKAANITLSIVKKSINVKKWYAVNGISISMNSISTNAAVIICSALLRADLQQDHGD